MQIPPFSHSRKNVTISLSRADITQEQNRGSQHQKAPGISLTLIPACLLGLLTSNAAVPTPTDLLAPGKNASLAVHVGTLDGKLEADLAQDGRRLVQGLALSPAIITSARQLIQERKLYGQATVILWLNPRRLPYADNMVNLLIMDRDALGPRAPDAPESMRVLAPNGVRFEKANGQWKATIKPRPADTDDWTHFDHGPSGNALSKDQRVAPPQQVQWISGIQPLLLGGNPAGFHGTSGFRISNGRVYSDALVGDRDTLPQYGAWDAYNGVPLWIQESQYKDRRRYYQVVAMDDRLYMFTKPGGPLAALDGDTGAIVQTYAAAGILNEMNPSLAYLRVTRDTLVVVNENRLIVLDRKSGRTLWTYQDQDHLLFFPSVDTAANRVYVVVSQETKEARIQHRWPNARAGSIVCLDFNSGETLWQNIDVAGRQVGQLVPNGPYLAAFAGGGIGAGKNPFYANLRVSDGKLLWKGTFKPEWNRAGYSLLWRDNKIYYADPWKVFTLDPETGVETPVFGRGYNARCMRFTSTPNYFIHGFVSYVDRDWKGSLQSVARSSCANSVFPANGMCYFTPNTCRCFSMLRGHLALTPEPLSPRVPDSQRLETVAPGLLNRTPTSEQTPPTDPGLLIQHWLAHPEAPDWSTAPVTTDDKTYVAVTHRHRLECRNAGGDLLWAYTADGRISSPPLIHRSRCFFASHDGRIYALNIADGSLAWRFLAAPAQRQIVAHGQLESSWPVYGVTLYMNQICASAGRHPEIGGGIRVWGLDPQTGSPAWERTLFKSPGVINGIERNEVIVPHSCVNGPLKTDGQKLILPGRREGVFAFDPATSDADLAERLNTNPPTRKRR